METFGLATYSFWCIFSFFLLFVLLACAGWKVYQKKKRDIENYKDPPDYHHPIVFRKRGRET